MTVLRSREISPSKIPPKKTLKTPTDLQPSTPSKNDLPSLPPPSAAAAAAIPLPYRRRRTPRFAVAEAPILNPAENSRRSTNRSDGGVGDDDDDDDDRTVKRRIDDAIVTAVPEGSSERRLTREEKGKEVLVGDAPLEAVGVGSDTDGLDGSAAAEVEDDEMMEAAVAAAAVEVENSRRRYHYHSYSMNQQRLEIFRAIAKRSSTKFALFNRHDEEEEEEAEEEAVEEEEEEKGWPGPFSTVERIMEDQELLKAKGLSLGPKRDDQVMKIDWSPLSAGRVCRTAPPSLLSLSMRVLANNAGEIETLRGVPDVMRHKLSQLLCRSRRMDCRFLRLLFEDRPSEVRVEDSSWISEEQLYDILSSFDSRCLKGLSSVLEELYIDDCQSVDAMMILPVLKKLKNLEVLSVARVERVCDKFIRELVSACGLSIKALVLEDCRNLTVASIKAIGEKCSNLRALDISKLHKLRDVALQHLANGCRTISELKLCGLAISDESVAAYIEASGESLVELSLNSVKEVLDLSFCREMTDEALGLIVDSCSNLVMLKLFGCSQVTDVFLDGHSNSAVKITGPKSCPILEHTDLSDF
ncbi:hypothetical protein QJS04_geneDACA013477 [Acorus gramineus]|uniref:Rad7 n=1 Tax=Acorus gramineus TaxID=55184 RepID=A0AAV9AIN4_ACOGR|nr:hypothetical protein QJS04_geneDACA013477 [Acorus gramineus]